MDNTRCTQQILLPHMLTLWVFPFSSIWWFQRDGFARCYKECQSHEPQLWFSFMHKLHAMWHQVGPLSTMRKVISMLKLPYTKSGVGLFKIGFLVCPTWMSGPNKPLVRLIQDLELQVPCTYLILDLKILSKFERWKGDVPKVSPNFQTRFQIPIHNKLTTF